MFDYLLFDLDGTLTDSQEGIMKSLQKAVDQFGIKLTYEQMRTMIGPPLDLTFKQTLKLTQTECDRGIETFRAYYDVQGLFENKPYDGIIDELDKLKASGKKMILATSKPEQTAIRIMKHFGLDKFFDVMCGGSLDESRSAKGLVIKYALETAGLTEKDKQRVLMIGDRKNDIAGAKENGIKSLGVLWGFGDREELETAGADYIISHTSELSSLLNSLR